jgi:PAS domain S-box-containing protein
MLNSQPVFLVLFLAAAFMSAISGIFVLIHNQTLMSFWGGVFLLIVAIDLGSYFLVLVSPNFSTVEKWFRVQIIAYVLLTISWMFFVFALTGHSKGMDWRFYVFFGLLPALLISVILFSGDLSPVTVYQDRHMIGSLMGLSHNIGPFGNLFIAYEFGAGFLALGLLFQMIISVNAYYQKLIWILALGLLGSLFMGVLEVAGVNFLAPFSSVQTFLILDSFMAAWAVFRLRIGEIIPIAHEMVFDHIQDGVLVLDQEDKVIDLNSAAEKIIGLSTKKCVGRQISQIWPEGAHLLEGQMGNSSPEKDIMIQLNGLDWTYDVRVSPVFTPNQDRVGRAFVLRNVTDRERLEKELQEHAIELEHTYDLISALFRVASRVSNASEPEMVLETLGAEMKKLGFECAVVGIDPDGEKATIKYLSYNPGLLQAAEKIIGFSLKNHMVPKRYWPGDAVLTEKVPVWYPNPQEVIHKFFPMVPESIAKGIFSMMGIQSTGEICILPLIARENVIGALPIWGADLHPADTPALSVFANQVASALTNTTLYENAQIEILERTQTEARLQAALDEKEILLREVHHRVKNNLQIISSLISLQSAQISDPKIEEALRESQNRVRIMALIHEKLYQSTNLTQVDFAAYLDSLVSYLDQSYRGRSNQVTVRKNIQNIFLDIDTAIPCGLIVNELVSNSLKYAFPDNRSGLIEVACRQLGNERYRLMVKDNGVGLPTGFDISKSSSLGLKLVSSLVQQIDGELALEMNHGTQIEITFAGKA